MAKVRDITDKLSFDGNPSLMINGKTLEVNADAPTMLKIMSFMDGDGVDASRINEAYELVFPEESRKEIDKMKLNFADWMTVVEEAIDLITEDDTASGEQ